MTHQSPITSHPSLRSLLRDAMARLEAAHVPSAPLAAELLLMHALGRDRAWLYAHTEHEMDAGQCERYFSLVARRANGVPTQYLTGHQEFWALDFEVTPGVLIPRPETEHVIEVALSLLAEQPLTCGGSLEQDRSRLSQIPQAKACATKIADVGTGSGCIGIALAHELPAARILATDISLAALRVARRNAERHGVSDRIKFIECNLLDPVFHDSRFTLRSLPAASGQANHPSLAGSGLRASQSRNFDLIASNPPYIGREEWATLPREVREHEPQSALYGGETGTEIYAPLIAQAASLLKHGGWLVLELGHDSREQVARLLDSPEWGSVSFTNDLAGIARVASAQRTESPAPGR